MLKHDWSALRALSHIREKRPIQVMTMDMMIGVVVGVVINLMSTCSTL